MSKRWGVIDEDELRRWIDEGKTALWVRDEYARKYGVTVSHSTTARWIREIRGSSTRQTAWQVPWHRPENSFAPRQLRRLRWLYRMDSGERLDAEKEREAANLVRLLDPLVDRPLAELVRSRATSLVVDYLPGEDRWVYVPRRLGLDAEWIREPWWNDDGTARSAVELEELGVRPELIVNRLLADG